MAIKKTNGIRKMQLIAYAEKAIRALSHAIGHLKMYIIDIRSGNQASAKTNKRLAQEILRKIKLRR